MARGVVENMNRKVLILVAAPMLYGCGTGAGPGSWRLDSVNGFPVTHTELLIMFPSGHFELPVGSGHYTLDRSEITFAFECTPTQGCPGSIQGTYAPERIVVVYPS